MARVVTRRSNPPYLLIVFVVLFLISTALAVMFYIRQGEATKKVAEKEQQLSDMYASGDNSVVQQAKTRSAPGSSVIHTLSQEVDDLAGIIKIDPKSYDAAQQAANHAYDYTNPDKGKDKGYARVGLAQLAENLYTDLQARTKELADERTVSQANADKLTKAEAEKADLQTQYKKKYDEISNQLVAVQKKAKDDFDKYQATLKTKDDDAVKKLDEKEKAITALEAEKLKLVAENAKLAKLAGELKAIVGDIKKPKNADLPTAAGKIVKLADSEKLCYINIGSDARVNVGMTFGVYPASEGVGENNKKADLKVTNVYTTTAQCAILSDSARNPVGLNDLIANIAYDKARNFTFVVDGVFDLNGSGVATPEGAQMVKDLIKRAGGVVADKMDMRTDYVVLGDAPSKPAKPADQTDATASTVYGEQLKAWQHYTDSEKLARELKLPVLNTNRFIAFVGYTPVAPSRR